jgi:hypothetical protein
METYTQKIIITGTSLGCIFKLDIPYSICVTVFGVFQPSLSLGINKTLVH